jgi:hypothetical protein
LRSAFVDPANALADVPVPNAAGGFLPGDAKLRRPGRDQQSDRQVEYHFAASAHNSAGQVRLVRSASQMGRAPGFVIRA